MAVKRILSAVLIIILFICSAACSFKKTEQVPVSIYVFENDINSDNAVKEYNQKHKDDRINEKKFYSDQEGEYASSLRKELASGKGPDIIVADPAMFPDLSKFIDNGCFSPLDEEMKRDESLKMGDYNEKVMNYGIYGGKRYLVPLNYTIDSVYTTKEILDKNNIDFGTAKPSLNDITTAASKFIKENKVKGKYFLNNLSFITIMRDSDGSYIDTENKSAKLDSSKFKELLKAYGRIYPAICPEERRQELAKGGDPSASLKDGNLILLNASAAGPKTLWGSYGSYASEVDPVIYPVPGVGKTAHTSAAVTQFAAINSKCSNKKVAFEFIKLLMSADFQAGSGMFNIPVNEKAYEIVKNDVLKNISDPDEPLGPRGGGCKTDASARKLVERLDSMIAGMGKCMMIDDEVWKIIEAGLQDFQNGKETADEAVKSMQRKVDGYFNEKFDAVKYSVPDNESEGSKKIVADNSVKANLKVYYKFYYKFVDNAIRFCKDKYPGLKFETVVSTENNNDEFDKRLVTEVMAGEGPDVVIFDDGTFNSIHKTVSSGVFCDLNDMIAKDREFKLSDYNEKVMDCGVFDGKRRLLPLEYTIDSLCTTSGILKNAGINADMAGLSFKNLKDIVTAYMKNKKGYANFFDDSINWYIFLRNSGLVLIDYKAMKTNFQSKDFIEFLDFYKSIRPAIGDYDFFRQSKSYADKLKNKGAIMLSCIGSYSSSNLCGINCEFEDELGESPELMNFPSFTGKQIARIIPELFAAINTGCANKEAAFAFIKVLLSNDLQGFCDSYGSQNIISFNPVNNKAFDENLDFYTGASKRDRAGVNAEDALPKSMAEHLRQTVSTAETPGIIDEEVYRIISDEMKYFLNGKKTAEQTAKTIDEKVVVYLNE